MATELLTLHDLQRVRKAVWDARANWRDIGLEIGLYADDLANIEGRDNGDRLTNMLTIWLQRPSLSPSLKKLVRALRTRSVDRSDIASQIEREYPEAGNAYGGQVRNGGAEVAGKLIRILQSVTGRCCIAVAVLIAILMAIALQWNYPESMKMFGGRSSEPQEMNRSINSSLVQNSTESNSTIGPNNLPYLPGPFMGRGKDIDTITTSLLSKSSWINVVGIYGLPTVGKSTLAIYVGYEVARRGVAVRYINLDDAYLKVLYGEDTSDYQSTSGVVAEDQGGTDVTKLDNTLVYYSELEEGYQRTSPQGLLEWAKLVKNQTLLILDNCDCFLQTDLEVEKFQHLLMELSKASHALHILITSQYRLFLTAGFMGYHLKNLSDQAAVELLSEQLKLSITIEQAETIAQLVGNLPLALNVIAGLLVSTSIPAEVIVGQLKEDPLRKEVHRILGLSYKYLDMSTRDCGHYLTVFPGSFSEDAVVAILKNFTNVKECLETLEKRSLIEHYWHAGESRYHLHKLVEEFFKRPTTNFEPPLSHDTVVCSFGKHFSQALLEFVRSHRMFRWSDDIEGVGRYEYESHNYRALIPLVNQMTITVSGCRKAIIMTMHDTISYDVNNLLLILLTKEQICELIRIFLTEELNQSSVSMGVIKYEKQNLMPSRQCEYSAQRAISHSECCQLCADICLNDSCPFCLCYHRQPSEQWEPVHDADTVVIILDTEPSYVPFSCLSTCEMVKELYPVLTALLLPQTPIAICHVLLLLAIQVHFIVTQKPRMQLDEFIIILLYLSIVDPVYCFLISMTGNPLSLRILVSLNIIGIIFLCSVLFFYCCIYCFGERRDTGTSDVEFLRTLYIVLLLLFVTILFVLNRFSSTLRKFDVVSQCDILVFYFD